MSLNSSEKAYICELYMLNKYSQRDIAVKVGVSSTSVRRVLAEKGLCKFTSYATPEQRALLRVLEARGIHNVDQLKQWIP